MRTFIGIWPQLLDLPIRDGNTGAVHVREPRPHLLDLPIRDGNPPAPSVPLSTASLLDLPIRDGNLRGGRAWSLFRGSFRPSYQGWKLGEAGPEAVMPLTFRPSYQGWKLSKTMPDSFISSTF